MIMKKIFLYTISAVIGLMSLTTSCSDFGDTNIDPEHLNEGNVKFNTLFTYAQLQALGSDWDVWRNGIIYSANMLQHTTSVEWAEGTFYTYNEIFNAAFWESLYSGNRGVIRDIVDVMRRWENVEGRENDYQMARIMKAYMFHRMTDLYGDIPYFEAGRAFDGIGYPVYDTQQVIYDDLLKELNEAQAALNVSGGDQLGTADVYFNGDIDKWKKFANSLILRIAMRLSKVDPAKAEQWVKTAVNNGIIEQTSDNAILFRPDGNVNDDSAEPYGKIFSQSEPNAFFLSEYFVNMLKSTNDPRLPLIGSVVENPSIPYSGQGYQRGDSNPDIQVGMPIGYDTKGDAWDISTAPGYPGANFRSVYSVPSRYTYADPQAPTMIVTYAQNQFLLAEAAYRGWLSGTSATGTAQQYYENGVRAAMAQFSYYPAATNLYSSYLNSTAVDEYLAANPFDQSRALEMINTQYYILNFCDEYETFANWRRSGYPELTPVDKNYANSVTNGTIPRRFTYPINESQSNPTNYNAAVERLPGGDRMTSRVWWDVNN